MSGTGIRCIRLSFCWLNILFLLAGFAVLAVGIWLQIAYENYAILLPHYSFLKVEYLTIFIGSLTIFVAFLACCGSWFKNKYLLLFYFCTVLVIIIVEFTIASLALIFEHHLKHYLKEELIYGITTHYNVTKDDQQNGLHVIWDVMQTQFKCCGVNNYEDWYMIDAWPSEKWVPDTCCLPAFEYTDCGKLHIEQNEHFYSQGCYGKIYGWFMEKMALVGTVLLIIGFVQFSGLIMSMLLFCTLKHKRNSKRLKPYK